MENPKWHRFECNYIATKVYSSGLKSILKVTDWIDTGSDNISINSVGHYWKTRGYIISEQNWNEVNIFPGELKAIVKIIE